MPLIKSSQVPTSVAPFSLASIETHARGMLTKAKVQAEAFLAAAQAEADELKKQSIAQGLAEGRKQGIAEGTEAGKKSGHAQALTEHREKLTALVNGLTKLAAQLEAQRGELESHGLKSVIELSAAIARKVTKRQAALDPQVMLENLQGAIKVVGHWADVRLAVHPTQLAVLKAELPGLQMKWPQLAHVELIEDKTLAPGGCRVFTAGGGVNGDLDEQLNRVIAQVLPAPLQGG